MPAQRFVPLEALVDQRGPGGCLRASHRLTLPDFISLVSSISLSAATIRVRVRARVDMKLCKDKKEDAQASFIQLPLTPLKVPNTVLIGRSADARKGRNSCRCHAVPDAQFLPCINRCWFTDANSNSVLGLLLMYHPVQL